MLLFLIEAWSLKSACEDCPPSCLAASCFSVADTRHAVRNINSSAGISHCTVRMEYLGICCERGILPDPLSKFYCVQAV